MCVSKELYLYLNLKTGTAFLLERFGSMETVLVFFWVYRSQCTLCSIIALVYDDALATTTTIYGFDNSNIVDVKTQMGTYSNTLCMAMSLNNSPYSV